MERAQILPITGAMTLINTSKWGVGALVTGVVTLALSSGSAVAAAHDKHLGVIGDSVAIGAVSSSTVDATVSSLLWSGMTRGRRAVDFPENSFAMIVASQFGVKRENVINVAADGKRVSMVGPQLDELYAALGKLPEYLVISFTANDACNENIYTTSVSDFKREYKRRLVEGIDGKGGLRKLIAMAPPDRDTRVIWLASLDFPQVLSNPLILNHVVPLHFSEVKCSQFRKGAPAAEAPTIRFIAEKLPKMCPAVLNTDPFSQAPLDVARREHLAAIYRSMIEAQDEALAVARSESSNSRLKFHMLSSPAHLKFTGDHVANDCFHLSAQGQGFLGMSSWFELYEQLKN